MINFIKKYLYKPSNGYLQLMLVGSVGAIGFILDLGILFLLINLYNIEPLVANLISTVIVIITNWLGNRTLVFHNHKPPFTEFIQFAVSSLAGLLVSTIAIWYIFYELSITSNIGLVAGKFAGLFAGILVKFFLYKYWVFKKTS